ncbi:MULTISPECIES: FAD/NAD(P)-binding protein [unclassified Streptomyces]|uniref:FAD/NAD(P)-binding protein n=1 Tax=unclassified Streptomyces TaxID=2593676 RepID=UPI000AABF654|nr:MULTISPECIES: FAD/NAD(P)-binding protein [unclassified Streptomyces]
MEPTRLAIVGGGPYCTYAMERLAATVRTIKFPFRFEVHVFERTGQFGAGGVHHPGQPRTSLLNRAATDISFGADESVTGAHTLLPPEFRESLQDWCDRRLHETGDTRFRITPGNLPQRRLHGLALRDFFRRYREILESHPGVSVHLHQSEVTDLLEAGPQTLRIVTSGDARQVTAHHVLMVTGHSLTGTGTPPGVRRAHEVARPSQERFVPCVYPLEVRLSELSLPPGQVVGCVGTMLTAVDAILHLTEGRGGRFVRQGDDGLTYVPSGREPGAIVTSSQSGLFAFARPMRVNGTPQVSPRGIFLTYEAIDRLRDSCGVAVQVDGEERMQLEYGRHILPLIILEMTYWHYAMLLGRDFAAALIRRVEPAYDSFLRGSSPSTSTADPLAQLLSPVESLVDEAENAIDALLTGKATFPHLARENRTWQLESALTRYAGVIFGVRAARSLSAALNGSGEAATVIADLKTPWRHGRLVRDNRFSWDRTVRPLPPQATRTPDAYRAALVDFMTQDIAWARQGILVNPAKTATDFVWRGLLTVIVYAVNNAGLTPTSHRDFLQHWRRHHNRLAYGPVPEVMEKLLALIRCGLLDVGTGPDGMVEKVADTFVVHGPRTGARRPVDVLIAARVPDFDASAEGSPLYPNLLRGGKVQLWRNPDPGTDAHFSPGGLDLDAAFHPRGTDGTIDTRITFLGPMAEAGRILHGGLVRPHTDYPAMRSLAAWNNELWEEIRRRGAEDAQAGSR